MLFDWLLRSHASIPKDSSIPPCSFGLSRSTGIQDACHLCKKATKITSMVASYFIFKLQTRSYQIQLNTFLSRSTWIFFLDLLRQCSVQQPIEAWSGFIPVNGFVRKTLGSPFRHNFSFLKSFRFTCNQSKQQQIKSGATSFHYILEPKTI